MPRTSLILLDPGVICAAWAIGWATASDNAATWKALAQAATPHLPEVTAGTHTLRVEHVAARSKGWGQQIGE